MKRLPRLVAAFVALTMAGCGGGSPQSSTTGATGAPPANAVAPIAGEWRGQLHQKGLAPFVVSATIGSDRQPSRNPVHYTGIDCSGNWTYLGTSHETKYRFREVIDRGRGGSCKGVGKVTLTRQAANRLRYEFRGGGIVSRGLLRR
jgi:hypothetical protein